MMLLRRRISRLRTRGARHRPRPAEKAQAEPGTGVPFVEIVGSKTPHARRQRKVECLVDAVAALTVLPGTLWRKLGVRPHETEQFALADGPTVERKIGRAYVQFEGRGEDSPVVFGEPKDSQLLGVLTRQILRL